ncbi:uncharacterized protein LAESUDRAFT_759977 [Laetiporus sulphureus 93-53]|uniref:Uncharacterized protein n=1 Tax=Laetiporus sulphureus 93-53 TaxID=1314785 RepID=A0A165DW01_9APHY|nr:uncharacterized protein LAESUDRAFT_759977 [Laetiporus sulphureus 93-53]KZT05740.1 hypothetical protein LAESUDRAFT_759977 [Laetiporus sulphureus 93-53]
MAIGMKKIRSGHVLRSSRKRDTCSSGGFYKSPSSGDVISSTSQVNITWDTSCLNTTAVDIYLFAPDTETPRIHAWEGVDYAFGSYNTTFQPSWWNSTSSVRLQLEIIESGDTLFMATLPAGPIFNMTYSGSQNSSTSQDSSSEAITKVDNVPSTSHGLSGGKTAAAVILPLLVVIAIVVGVYVWRSRKKGRSERKRFSVAIDKRMSTISSEWKSVTTAGATAAIRNSMHVSERTSTSPENRSSFSLSNIRSSSTFAVESGHAGIGTRGVQMMTEKPSLDFSAPHMAQVRPNVRTSAYSAADRTSRVSRVSFAPDTRPSSEYRRTRAFHADHVPPLPDAYTRDPGEMSPTQTEGPMTLTVDDIRARMAGQDVPPRTSMDAVLPALSMMRTGRSSAEDEMVFPGASTLPPSQHTTLPTAPEPVHQSTVSPIASTIPYVSAAMSPDAMLRAYADQTLRSPPPSAALALLPPAANLGSGTMRILYTPASPPDAAAPHPPPPASPESLYPTTPEPRTSAAVDAQRQSFATSAEETHLGEENVHFGTAQ